MPTQEQNALARYEALKEIIRAKKSMHADLVFATMFNNYGILERTTSRYLKYLKALKFIKTEGQMVIWLKN